MLTPVVFSALVQATEVEHPSTQTDMAQLLLAPLVSLAVIKQLKVIIGFIAGR
jgi:hypothetical protein